jgi:aspartate/methionine/tyrosine aminotransferase
VNQYLLPSKAFEAVLAEEMASRRKPGAWNPEWGDPTPEKVEEIARNILRANKVYEYPTRGLRDDLREFVALRIAPWLRPDPTTARSRNGR